eukprot:Mycagemm_TRINITY_DN10289_c2_g9::TRINITY_DN10289_c2_g9_i1::g.3606::m.3606 type:complete len:235 gc:universal TRINITY_DN10289_c2_g9_i1:998-294(-)
MLPQAPTNGQNARPSLRVLLYTGQGARGRGIPLLASLIREHGGSVVTSETIPENTRRDNTDVIILPGGSASSELNGLGGRGKGIIRRFVESGGGYVGICAGAFAGSGCTQHEDFGLRLLPALYLRHKVPRTDVRGSIVLALSGEAVQWGGQDEVTCWYHNGPLFPAYNLPAGVRVLATIKEGVNGVKRMNRRATIVAGKYGRGTVILCGPHPEQTDALQSFTWRMICDAAPQQP